MTLVSLATAVILVAGVPLIALYLQLVERKVLADFQVRLGPMRVGPHGLLQPIADVIKLALKEDLAPAEADRALFWIAPIFATFAALAAFTVLPLSRGIFVIDVNVGILVTSAAAALGVLGIVIGGWSSNSHYSLLGALRSAAQLISYEVALGFALLSGLMAAGTLSMQGIVRAQNDRNIWFAFSNYGFMLFPFAIFLLAITAEANRAPFDLPEAESELIGGYHTEYSGLRWSFFMLAEYANMLLACAVGVTLFWGGWLRPFPNTAWLAWPMNAGIPAALGAFVAFFCVRMALRLRQRSQQILLIVVATVLFLIGALFLAPAISRLASATFWFLLKLSFLIYAMIWFRGTFPRLRYDQLMRLGWVYMIPAGMACLLINAVLGLL
ncbi:MAG: NADH-quinone oxidoreductase subunit H [Acidobacteriota bacterium]|nr:NADH-quinone oxidoreductase subunit H [Acidobacteriota bacterium]